MQYIYIDESGSMTFHHAVHNPYFVVAIVRTENPEKLKRLHKRFVEKHMDALKAADTESRMFKNGKFSELKGCAFTPELKREFVSFFCREGTMDIFYIVVDNRLVKSENLFKNTARAFNYILRLALGYFVKNGLLPDDHYLLNLDERNEKTDSRHFLQNYLNTEFSMEHVLSHDLFVRYYDSSMNRNVQIADILANLYFSELKTGAYGKEIQAMKDSKCLKFVFKFPL